MVYINVWSRTWTWFNADISRLVAAEMRLLRSIERRNIEERERERERKKKFKINIVEDKVKLSLLWSMEAHRVARG
jgi:hypothetical protein